MKGLSLWQPHATLMALDEKRFETRSWGTDYDGPLAIHATAAFPRDARDLCCEEPFRSTLARAGFYNQDQLPRAAIIAVTTLLGCIPAEDMDWDRGGHPLAACYEREFGNYAPGRKAWITRCVIPLKDPVPCRGSMGLWDVPADVQEKITAQLKARGGGAMKITKQTPQTPRWIVLDGHCLGESMSETDEDFAALVLAHAKAAPESKDARRRVRELTPILAAKRVRDRMPSAHLVITVAFCSRVMLAVGIMCFGWRQTLTTGIVMSFAGVCLYAWEQRLAARMEAGR